MFEAYKALAGYEHQVKTFVNNACYNRSDNAPYVMAGNFQILPAVSNGPDSVATVFGSFYFEAHVKVYRYTEHQVDWPVIIFQCY